MKNANLILLFLISFGISAFAGGPITGKVLDAENNPIAYANVIVYDAADSSFVKAEFTYEDGSFKIPDLGNGKYYILINYVGLPDFVTEVFETPDTNTLDLGTTIMGPSNLELDEVTITAKRPLLEMKPDKMVFNVEGSINASGSDAMELLRKAPGVVVDNNDNITLLGKSGVRVFIDGKPSPLSSEDLAAYLSTLQSDQIDNIEIITNPPAKYEAEGNGGIINIRLKKNENLGTNGSISQSFQQGLKSRYNGSFTGNWKAEKSNLFGSVGYYNGGNENPFNIYREQFGYSFDQLSDQQGEWKGVNYRLGLDYYLNDKSTFGILVNGNVNEGNWYSSSNTSIGLLATNEISQLLVAESDNNWDRVNNNVNVNYKFESGKGKSLNIDLDAGFYRNERTALQPNFYKSADGSVILNEITNFTNSPNDIDIYTFKLDYELPALKGKIGLGTKSSFVRTDNTFDFFDVIYEGQVINEDQSNNFLYEELVNAVYGTYARKLSKFNIQLGMRIEHTHSDGMLTAYINTENENVVRNYLDFFPSGGITFTANQKNNFQLNFSRRLNRPSYQDLNPFRSKLDELTFELGNPFLQPEYTNNIQLSHSYNYRFTTTLGFSHTTDLITRQTDVEGEQSAFITWLNLADQYNYSLNFAAPIPITKWWNSYTSVTGVLMQNNADFGDGKVVDLEQTSLNVYSQHSFSLPRGFNLEVSGWYQSPMLWGGTFEMNSMWNMDIGIQTKILNGAGNLKFAVSDVFKTQDFSGSSLFGDLFLDINGSNDSRRARLSVSYNFGNKKIKTRKRKTGLEDEARRIKNKNG